MPFAQLASFWSARAAVRHALADWRAGGLLGPNAAREVWADTEPDPLAWRRWLDRALLVLGIALLCAGVVVFFAFNWQALHRWVRFALLGALVIGLATVAWRRPDRDPHARAALFAAQIATGVLLGVIGQVYQTGADAWQWFAWWALLALPWALAARAAPHWWLAFALLNAALMRWFSIRLGAGGVLELLFGVTGGRRAALALLIAAIVQLAIWLAMAKAVPRLGLRGQTGPRMLAALATGHAAWLGLAALFARDFDPGLLAVALLSLGMLGGWFLLRRFDIVILSLVALALIALAVAAVGRLVFESNSDMGGFLLLGLLTVCLSGAAATWLTRLHRRHAGAAASTQDDTQTGVHPGCGLAVPRAPAVAVESLWLSLAARGLVDGAMPQAAGTPWAVRLLTGMAGWLGAVFFLLFLLGAVFVAARENITAMGLCAIGLIALAALLYWRRAGHTGFEQFALASSLTGQGLLLYASADALGGARAIETASFWLGAGGVEAWLYLTVGNRLHRLLTAWAAGSALALALAIVIAGGAPDRWQSIVWSLVWLAPAACGLAALFSFAEPRLAAGPTHRLLTPGADAVLLCGLIGALAVTGMSHPLGVMFDDGRPVADGHWLAGAALGVVLVASCAAEARRLGLALPHRIAAVLATAGVAALMTGAPAVVAGLLALGLGLRRASPPWVAMGATAIGLGFLWYYSALHWTLLAKSATLAAAGIAVLLVRSRLPRSHRSIAPARAVTEGAQ